MLKTVGSFPACPACRQAGQAGVFGMTEWGTSF